METDKINALNFCYEKMTFTTRVLSLMRAYEALFDFYCALLDQSNVGEKDASYDGAAEYTDRLLDGIGATLLPKWVIETKPEDLPDFLREMLPKKLWGNWE